jgi:hypothetical protein
VAVTVGAVTIIPCGESKKKSKIERWVPAPKSRIKKSASTR